MHKYSPAESIHALDVSSLRDPSLTFWSARVDGKLAACGALKELSPNVGEIKSMKTSKHFLRQGMAEKILLKLIAEASGRSYVNVSLETGSDNAFKPAIALYEKHGFKECDPFFPYKEDPYSKFYSKKL
jgi:putative acetyltransferase